MMGSFNSGFYLFHHFIYTWDEINNHKLNIVEKCDINYNKGIVFIICIGMLWWWRFNT